MNCPKCDFVDDKESEVRIHSLYVHGFFLPQCSTQLAKQGNLDYDEVRKNYKRLQKRIQTNRNLLRYIPYKWESTVSKIRNNVRHGYKWNQYQVYEHVKSLPKYMRRLKREKELEENMNIMRQYIKQEGIVI